MKYDGDLRLRLEKTELDKFKQKTKKKKKKHTNLIREFIKRWNKRN